MDTETANRLPALLHPGVQNVARAFSLVMISAIGLYAFVSGGRASDSSLSTAAQSRAVLRIDINQAGQQELTLMPGIGTLTAQRILEDRSTHGPFGSIGDLERVRGVGPKTVREISPYCRVGSSENLLARKALVAEQ